MCTYNLSLSEIVKKIDNGSASDIDYFMSILTNESSIETIKIIDFALSQVRSSDGVKQIKYYLFNGTKIQRSYAALYFKRHQKFEILKQAVKENCIDNIQTFSI